MPQRVRAEAYPLGYVEGLNEARTPLADTFNSLPKSTWYLETYAEDRFYTDIGLRHRGLQYERWTVVDA